MKRRTRDINITWNGRPTRYWLRMRSWGNQPVRRGAKPQAPRWMARMRLNRAEWVVRAREVRQSMKEVDAVLTPLYGLIERALERGSET